jgi:spore coat polysaccharide biosynthesis protein SpsF
MKIGFFITARLKSSRLKQKILLDLNGKTAIERVIERCKATVGVDGVVLCTSTNPQDSVLYNYALKEGIQFYAGSEDDVLQRLLDAAKYYHYDALVSITADNPLFSIYTSQILIDTFKSTPFDFGFTKGLPVGLGTTMIETKALDVAVHIKKQSDTEIWGPFVNRPDFFNIFTLNVNNSPFKRDKRLTLDYSEDYELMQNIYQRINSNSIIDIKRLFNLLKENPSLWEKNKNQSQKMPSQKDLDKISRIFDNNKEAGIKRANNIHKKLISANNTLNISVL